MTRTSGGALVLADGAVPSRALLDASWLGLRLDRWVGDGDSIEPAALAALAAAGVDVRRSPIDKDESDTELAVLAVVEAGAASLTILGALGGVRVDHALSNVALLEHPALDGIDAWLYDEHAVRISLLTAGAATGPVTREAAGRAGDIVSLIPLGAMALGVTTHGLRYPLAGEALVLGRTRGVSNVRTDPVARITLESGRLLLIETPATVRP